MKITVSWKHVLLLAHAGLLIAALALGRWLYAGALGQSDVLAVINPYPQVTMADNLAHCPVNPFPQIKARSGHIASNIFIYMGDWYRGMNGRLSVAMMDSLIARAAKAWCPTPESFPWWLMRALSLFCLLATPLNFMAAVGLPAYARLPETTRVGQGWTWKKRPGMTFILLAAIWSVWIVSPKIYIFSVMFDILLTDRYIHGYVLSWMMIGVIRNWMGKSVWKWGLLAAGILFLNSEQNMFSVPILLLAAAWMGLEGKAGMGRDWLRQAFYYGAWTCLAALIFFLSPGQRLRNICLPWNSISNFSPLEWYQNVITLGYGALFPRLPGSLWIWHLILYVGLGLIMAAWLIIRLKKGAPDRLPHRELFGIGLMAFAFLTAFLASMTTLIVSPYFPPYAIYYPSLLLVSGLAFSFWFVLDGAALVMDELLAKVFFYRFRTHPPLRVPLQGGEHTNFLRSPPPEGWPKARVGSGLTSVTDSDMIASSSQVSRFAGLRQIIGYVKAGCLTVLPILVTIALIGTVTVRAWPAMAEGYHQIMKLNHVRRQLYAEIVERRNTTGQRHFILVNLWKAPVWGLHMDEAWGRAGYFRWRRMEDVVCLTENEWIAAGRPEEQLYLKIDCAKFLQDQSDRRR